MIWKIRQVRQIKRIFWKGGLGGWYSGIILVSGTRDPGFNSRIALIFNKIQETDKAY